MAAYMPGDDVIVARNVEKHFPLREGLFRRKVLPPIRAVDGVSFSIPRGSCFAIVGESGSGKSTLARMIVGLWRATAGDIIVAGNDLSTQSSALARKMRRKVQLVLQDPHASLDPRMTVRATLREALIVHRLCPDRAAQNRRIEQVIRQVGLSLTHLDRFPNALSGGQRQRVAIARGIIIEPDVLVLDEPVSALDVSVQAQIINLLVQLQHSLKLTYIIITHDLSLVTHMADAVGVMYLGRFVEQGPTSAVCSSPAHPYTDSLLSAVAGIDADFEKTRPVSILQGAIPSPTALPTGCTFHTRCPRARLIGPGLPENERVSLDDGVIPSACMQTAPQTRNYGTCGVTLTCHFPGTPVPDETHKADRL
jgi:oligopeptide/dipeptide ABC transporter ATP-binding protein